MQDNIILSPLANKIFSELPNYLTLCSKYEIMIIVNRKPGR